MLKLLVMLIISAVAAIALYFLCNFLGRQIVDQAWLSPRRTESRITADIHSFRNFVEENNITSTDAQSIGPNIDLEPLFFSIFIYSKE